MTHFANKSSDQRGALMMEAIALLGLMTMMSPMVVRQSSERITEMEDVTVAAQMKNLKEALANFMEANYGELIPTNKQKSTSVVSTLTDSADSHKQRITLNDLMPYMPASYVSGSALRGNKLLDQFNFGVRATCSELIKKSASADCSAGPTNGIYVPTANCDCGRYKLTGVVVAGRDTAIPDKRASRIASMIGADGGYVRSKEAAEAMVETEADRKNLIGSQGMWEARPGDFSLAAGVPDHGGMIVASTAYSAGRSADYLYRKKVNGIPDANSMFTDLDMGGSGACDTSSSDGSCSRINNAGGVEVVGGRLIVRGKNTADGLDQENGADGTTYARIFLGTDEARMDVTGGVVIRANEDVNTKMTKESNKIKIDAKETIASTAKDITVTATKVGEAGGTITSLASKKIEIKVADANTSSITMDDQKTIKMKTGDSTLDMADATIDIYASKAGSGTVSVKGKKRRQNRRRKQQYRADRGKRYRR